MKKIIFIIVVLGVCLVRVAAQNVQIKKVETVPPSCKPLAESQFLIYKYTEMPGLYYCTAAGTYQPTTLVSLTEITTDFSSTGQKAVLSSLPQMFRRNYADNFLNGYAIDAIANYNDPEEANLPLIYLQYNIDVESNIKSYKAIDLTLDHNTSDTGINGKNLTGISVAARGLGGADIHDIKGILATARAAGGTRVGSNLSAGAFSSTVISGSGHADISDIILGFGSVSNTDVRSYQQIWLKKTALTNVIFRDYGEPFSIRNDSGYLSRFFGNIKLDNSNPASAGAAKVPLTIVLNSSQSADAFNIFASDGTTDRFKINASGDTTVGGKFHVTKNQTPASASEPCSTGQIAWDVGFLYVCVGVNVWKRAALSDW